MNSQPSAESPTLNHGQPPIYFAGGFGYDQQRNTAASEYLNQLGYETVPPLPDINSATIDPGFTLIKDGVKSAVSRGRAMRMVGRLQGETLIANMQEQRADELIQNLDQSGQGKVNAFVASADTLNTTLAVSKRPDLFNNIVLAYLGGIIRQPKPLEAARGILASRRLAKEHTTTVEVADSFDTTDRKQVRRAAVGALASSAATAASVTLSYQGSILSEIRAQQDAPGISLVLGTRDWMIRPELVLKSLRSSTDVDYILVTDSGHGINGRTDVMDAALQLFPKMDVLKADRQAGTDAIIPLTDRMIFLGDISQDERDQLRELAAAVDKRSEIK